MPGPAQPPPGIGALDSREVSVALGRRLRELRTERGISQGGLAHRTGVHTTAIGRMERGVREPRATMILRLAQGLEVPPAALLDTLAGTEDRHDIDPQEGGEA